MSGVGFSPPNDMIFLDWNINSFSVAGGTDMTNGVEVNGSRKPVSMSSAKNVSDSAVTKNLFLSEFQILSALFATNSTDSYTIGLQWSADGGTTWNPGGQNMAQITFNNGDINKHGCDIQTAYVYTAPSFPITNPLLFRLLVTDVTNPTTDIFTVTNLRATMELVVIK